MNDVKKKQIVFHGTSKRKWKQRRRGEQTLYLVNDLKEAASYAFEEAACDEGEGLSPHPIVLAIAIGELDGLEFGPDWGWSEATEESTWRDSLDAVGSFTVRGDVERYKTLFVRVPKKSWMG